MWPYENQRPAMYVCIVMLCGNIEGRSESNVCMNGCGERKC